MKKKIARIIKETLVRIGAFVMAGAFVLVIFFGAANILIAFIDNSNLQESPGIAFLVGGIALITACYVATQKEIY